MSGDGKGPREGGAAPGADGGSPIPIHAGPEAESWLEEIAGRAADRADRASEAARGILREVRRGGDEALLRLSEEHDGVRPEPIEVPAARCRRALERLPDATRAALERACRNVGRFHAAQRRREAPVEVEPGVTAWRVFRPLDRVGVYAPGGRAPYPSSLVMTAVPARVAGCREIVACSPPGPDGLPARPVMAAAALVEVDALYALGGAQAVGAMAYGTPSVPPVDKIFGPGSRWVEAAKMEVARDVAVDLPAGPSEVAVWADRRADPDLVAAELLAQAEHGPDSLAAGVLAEEETAGRVAARLEERLRATPRRDDAARSLTRSALLVAGDDDRAARWVNRLAAEHLVVLRDDAGDVLPRVRHAGSVFLGPHTPVAAGDYASGTNHVLPTRRRGRAAGGLGLDDFGKWMQVQRMDREGLRSLGPTIVTLAEWEGFPAHAESVRARTGGPGAPRDEVGEGRSGSAGGGPALRAPEAGGARLDALVRPHLREVEPYVTARSQHRGGVLLDANENPWGSLVPEAGPDLHRYPDPANRELREAIARVEGVDPDRIWPGNGSDEVIDVLIRTLVSPGEPVVVVEPTYGVYAARARTHDARVRTVRLDAAHDLDVDAAAAAAGGAQLVLLCSPNNPTGGRLSASRVLDLVGRCRAVVAVDEAYVEYDTRPSLAPRAGDPRRLAVLRTFSKAWGLAGARVGWLAASPRLVSWMSRAGLPYPLSALSARAALRALDREEEMERRVERVREERERMRDGLEALGLEVLPSDANFLLFFVEEPGAVQSRLARRHGVVVRDRSDLPGLAGGLRVSVGRPEENDQFLSGLEEVLGR